jgi:hypothetical protein
MRDRDNSRVNVLRPLRIGRLWNEDGTQGGPSRCHGFRCYSYAVEAEGGYSKMPEGKHANLGVRDVSGSPLQGYHQQMGENDSLLRANLDRLQVQHWIGWNGQLEWTPVMRLVNGLEGRPGGVEINEFFLEKVPWAPGRFFKFLIEYQFGSLDEERTEINLARVRANKKPYKPRRKLKPTPLYLNPELKGTLAFTPLDNPPEVLSFNVQTLTDDNGMLYLKWWARAEEDADKRKREKVAFEYATLRGKWYRYAALLTGLETAYSWEFKTRVSVREANHWDPIWEYHDPAKPLVAVKELGFCGYGDEHNIPRDQTGGIVRLTQPRAWVSDSPAGADEFD